MCMIQGSSPSTAKEKGERRWYSQQHFQYGQKGEGTQTPTQEGISVKWFISITGNWSAIERYDMIGMMMSL